MSSHLHLAIDNPTPRSAPRARVMLALLPGRFQTTHHPDHCLDCAGCSGICDAYLEAMKLPDAILDRRRQRP